MASTYIDAKGKDVTVSGKRYGDCLRVYNAKNVTIRGCELVLEQVSDSGTITLHQCLGDILIEGCFIDNKNKYADCLRIFKSPGASMLVRKCFFQDQSYDFNPGGIHGDLIHLQGDGPLKWFRLEDFCGLAGGQGLFLPYQIGNCGSKRIELERVSIGWSPRRPAGNKDMTLIALGDGGSRDRYSPDGTKLRDVFVSRANAHGSFHPLQPSIPFGGKFPNGFDGTILEGWRDWVLPKDVGLAYVGGDDGGGGTGGGVIGGDDGGGGTGGGVYVRMPTGGVEGQVLMLAGDGSVIWADPPVVTVFGRTGEVDAKVGDYTNEQIVEARIKAAEDKILAALDTLKGSLGA